MKENSFDIIVSKALLFFIGAFFSAAFVGRLFMFYEIEFTNRFTFLVNLVFELFILYFFFKNCYDKKFFLATLLLLFSFLIGQAFLKFKYFQLEKLGNEIINGDILQANKYVLIFFFIPVFQKLNNKKQLLTKIFKLLKIILYINAGLILIGLAFNMEIFKSYPYSQRFGFMGVLSTNTFAQFIYMILITYLYKKYLVNKKNILELIFTCIIALLLGKKAIVLFLIFLFIYHFCYISKNRKINFFFSIILLFLVVYNKNYLINVFLDLFPFWKEFDVSNNLITFLSSLRDVRLQNAIEFVNQNWSFPNYIFGGVNFPDSRVEMGIIDIYMFFGVVGLLVYFYLCKKLFNNLPLKDIILLLFVIIIAALTGSFFVNVNLVVFYYLLIAFFKDYQH